MALSVKDQNKQLADAGKTPKDTSGRTQDATRYSAKISSSTSKSSAPQGQQIVTKSSGKVAKGSFEGYMYNRSAVLQFNNVGYDSKSNQKARYVKSFANHSFYEKIKNGFTRNKNYSIMNNYSSITGEKTSSDRLSNIVKDNMMFR